MVFIILVTFRFFFFKLISQFSVGIADIHEWNCDDGFAASNANGYENYVHSTTQTDDAIKYQEEINMFEKCVIWEVLEQRKSLEIAKKADAKRRFFFMEGKLNFRIFISLNYK